jgi:hypothetical protein
VGTVDARGEPGELKHGVLGLGDAFAQSFALLSLALYLVRLRALDRHRNVLGYAAHAVVKVSRTSSAS